jgi:hypothetical protein
VKKLFLLGLLMMGTVAQGECYEHINILLPNESLLRQASNELDKRSFLTQVFDEIFWKTSAKGAAERINVLLKMELVLVHSLKSIEGEEQTVFSSNLDSSAATISKMICTGAEREFLNGSCEEEIARILPQADVDTIKNECKLLRLALEACVKRRLEMLQKKVD